MEQRADVVVIGAGAIGALYAAELKQLRPQCRILVLDRGSEAQHKVGESTVTGFCRYLGRVGLRTSQLARLFFPKHGFVLLAPLLFLLACNRGEGHVLDLSINGKHTGTIDVTESNGQAQIDAGLAVAAVADGSKIELKSRPNAKNQTFSYAYDVKKSGTRWQIFFAGTANKAGEAASVTELKSLVARELASFVQLHKRENAKP